MAKITWLGEDGPGVAGPSFTTCYGGLKFPKGEAVEVSDPDIIKRASKNQYFAVEMDEEPQEDHEEVELSSDDSLDHMKVAELREMAEAKGIEHAGMSKADLREALKNADVQDQI